MSNLGPDDEYGKCAKCGKRFVVRASAQNDEERTHCYTCRTMAKAASDPELQAKFKGLIDNYLQETGRTKPSDQWKY